MLGDFDAAEAAFRESLGIARTLRDRLDTPATERDLSVSLNNLARIALARGDLDAADTAFGESLGIRRALRDRLGTPETERDLVVSHLALARIADARNDPTAIRAALTEARVAAEAFGRQQPVSDAAAMLAHIDQRFAALG